MNVSTSPNISAAFPHITRGGGDRLPSLKSPLGGGSRLLSIDGACMTEHVVKCWTQFYCATVDRAEKPFEVRLNDRQFQRGDTLRLQEIVAANKLPGHPVEAGDDLAFSGREASARISYVLGHFGGLRSGYVVLGLDEIQALPIALARAVA